MHLKVFLQLENPKNSLFWANIYKKTPKNQKKTQKPTGLGFFFKARVFSNPCFKGLEIESNGVLIVLDYEGRPKGEAFVQFTTTAGAARALEKNKQNMGHRYIEVFMSSMEEAKRAQVSYSFLTDTVRYIVIQRIFSSVPDPMDLYRI